MKCQICGKEKTDASFVEGLYENQVVVVCSNCAYMEDIPVIRHATPEQLAKANQSKTVRETMMKISGLNKLHSLGPDSGIAARNLGKIKFPAKFEEPLDLVENYPWVIRIARRRTKLSTKQIAQSINIPVEVLDNIEKGMLPKDYQEIMPLIESALGIKVMKKSGARLNYAKPLKMLETSESNDQAREQIKHEMSNKIGKGEFDFSNKRNLDNLTLDDLREMKKQREKTQKNSADDDFLGSVSIDDIEEL